MARTYGSRASHAGSPARGWWFPSFTPHLAISRSATVRRVPLIGGANSYLLPGGAGRSSMGSCCPWRRSIPTRPGSARCFSSEASPSPVVSRSGSYPPSSSSWTTRSVSCLFREFQSSAGSMAERGTFRMTTSSGGAAGAGALFFFVRSRTVAMARLLGKKCDECLSLGQDSSGCPRAGERVIGQRDHRLSPVKSLTRASCVRVYRAMRISCAEAHACM